MLCQIVENGGYIILILCLFISKGNSYKREKITTIQDFCSDNSFIRNIEPGDPYTLTFKSEPSSSRENKWYHKSKRKCRQEFKTSDSAAHFVVTIFNMSIPSCDNCRCNYFEISVSGHTKRFCGNKEEDYFASKSDKLFIEFHHAMTLSFDVTFIFTVERNFYIITGTPKDNSVSSNFIETPYFPTPYTPNYKAEYVLQSGDPSSHVLLLFLDFQISHHSFIEVIGNNGTHPTRFYGDIFRPPVIVSQSDRLTLSFQSDDQPNLAGFRAISSFIKSTDSLVVPYTDCAGSRNNRGGYISVKTHEGFGLYDCVWHLVPFFPYSKSNLAVSTHLRNISHKSSLEIRYGPYSKSKVIKEINCETQDCSSYDFENIVQASEYLYIRFSGYLDVYSVINMTYSTFHSGNCSDKEFKCENGRCLLSDFRCDGIPHCPSGNDEKFCTSANIYDNETPPSGASFHSEDIYTYFVSIGCFGLVLVIIMILVFIYNYCKNKRVTTEPVQNWRISEELSDIQPTLYPVNPCNCESPPSYEGFVKSSLSFPPLLYRKASQCIIPGDAYAQCTTSFCSGARVRHHSADSCTNRNSETDSGDMFFNITGEFPYQHQNSKTCSVEIIQNNIAFKSSKNTVKRSNSLDSTLNNLVTCDACHLLLSVVHPACTHASGDMSQWHTLPPNFKIKSFKNFRENKAKINEPSWLQLDSNINFLKDRRFSWSFVPCRSVNSEFVTVVKTRCFSEPCKGISIHYSLY